MGRSVVEELISSIIESNVCENGIIDSEENASQFKEIEMPQIENHSVVAELDNVTQNKEIVLNEEISYGIKTEEIAKSEETNLYENEINTNQIDINDHQENDGIGESEFDTDEEDDIAQLSGLKIGNAIESEEIFQTESGKQQ